MRSILNALVRVVKFWIIFFCVLGLVYFINTTRDTEQKDQTKRLLKVDQELKVGLTVFPFYEYKISYDGKNVEFSTYLELTKKVEVSKIDECSNVELNGKKIEVCIAPDGVIIRLKDNNIRFH